MGVQWGIISLLETFVLDNGRFDGFRLSYGLFRGDRRPSCYFGPELSGDVEQSFFSFE